MIISSYFILFLFKHKVLSVFAGFVILLVLSYLIQAYRRSFFIIECVCNNIEPVDVVYTWVNGSDHKFLANLRTYMNEMNSSCQTDLSLQRFNDKHELKFSLRSLEKYAPWVRHIYIVTNGQIPYWLNLDHEKITLVSHDVIFPDKNHLDTFSSPAIESHLHRIPGLSNKFLYLNDDIFLGKPVFLDDFYTPNDGFIIYLAWPIPMCSQDCPWIYVGDKECDLPCLNDNCQMDGGDCDFGTGFDHQYVQPYFIQNWNLNPDKNESNNVAEIVKNHNKKVLYREKIKRKKRNVSVKYEPPQTSYDPIDTYRASLQHTNRILNNKYGFLPRYTPAHVPILIDKEIMTNLQNTFEKNFQKTSGNRVRREDDMQYSFSYYYFIIHEMKMKKIEEIFDMFDTDSSGTWSDREIRTILTRLYPLPLTYEMVVNFESVILNCSKNPNFDVQFVPEFERYVDSKLPLVTKNMITGCETIAKILVENFGKIPKYEHKVVKNAQEKYAIFKMLTSNVSHVAGNLDEIRQQPKKFICLNDNMDDKSESDNEMVRAILYDFYISFFPNPSQFELPSHLKNRFSYLQDLQVWKNYHQGEFYTGA